jgi:tRNA dimethylallyltransferase
MAGERPRVLFLMGATATGKTQLAVELVARLPLEIVSVDSAMVYRGMDIGTAKPDRATLARAPHRLVDIRDPSETYSAAQFRADGRQAIDDILAAGRTPLLVGGTMLYFKALESGLAELPPADPGVRARLAAEAVLFGTAHLHARLARVDPEAAARIHPNDPQRVQRALEVWELTARPLSALQAASRDTLPYEVVKLACTPPEREILRERIDARFHRMLDEGLESEVAGLLARGDLAPDLPSLRAVGYRQMVRYLLGECDRQAMIEAAIHATRQLAKRQMTWLRSTPQVAWLDIDRPLAQALKIAAMAVS